MVRNRTSMLLVRALLPLLLVCGCASQTQTQTQTYGVRDPASGINQRSYALSEGVDRRLLKPVARAYGRVVPKSVQRGVRNFFNNIRGLDSALNGFLQGKPRRGVIDVGRVLVNTTLGLGGLFDPATGVGLEFQDEDFGQTLAVWGYTDSAYVYVPVVGPLTVRDLPVVVFRFAVPRFLLGDYYNLGVGALDVVTLRHEALALSEVRDATALDPYVFTREAYYQRRRYQIFDGNPPTIDLFDEFDNEFDDDLQVELDNDSNRERNAQHLELRVGDRKP